MRTGVEIQLPPADWVRLEKLVAAPMAPQKHVWRVRVVLLSAVWRGDGANHAPDHAIQADGMALAGKVCR